MKHWRLWVGAVPIIVLGLAHRSAWGVSRGAGWLLDRVVMWAAGNETEVL